MSQEAVNHPSHYQSESGIEVIDVIEAFGDAKGFCLMNAVKYILRAGKKGDFIEDIKKAIWYLKYLVAKEEKKPKPEPLFFDIASYTDRKDYCIWLEADGRVRALGWGGIWEIEVKTDVNTMVWIGNWIDLVEGLKAGTEHYNRFQQRGKNEQ